MTQSKDGLEDEEDENEVKNVKERKVGEGVGGGRMLAIYQTKREI